MTLTGWMVFALTGLASMIDASPAGAQTSSDRATARKLAGQAIALMDAEDYEAALDAFREADTLVPAPTLKIRIARCLDALDRMQEAASVYREIIATELTARAPEPHRRARRDAVPELASLLAEVPSVLVTVEGEGAENASVSMSGTPLPPEALSERQPLDPGVYAFTAQVGDRQVREELELTRGQKVRVVLVLPPPRPDDPNRSPDGVDEGNAYRLGAYVSWGIGGAALIAGAATGGVVLSRRGDLETRCPDGCLPADHDDARAFNDTRIASTAMFAVAGAGALIGTLLYVFAPGSDEEDGGTTGQAAADATGLEVRPWVEALGWGSTDASGWGPRGIALRGRF